MRTRANPGLRLAAVLLAALLFLCLPALLAFAGADEVPSSARSERAVAQTSGPLEADLAAQGLTLGSAVYFQITKQPARLTAFVAGPDDTFHAFRTWPVCSYSGQLGPKRAEGDRQAPEGFYSVRPAQMNPASSYHLSFDLGYPNAYDRAHGRTGGYLMVHGSCVSIGCFAMTDPVIEEVWTLMDAAFENGQRQVPVHIFPFAMTAANLQRHAGQADSAFWRSLAPAWAAFETTGRVPDMRVVSGRYVMAAQ